MLKTRVITATILLAVLLPILFWLPPIYLSIAFLIMMSLAAWEWASLVTPNAKKAAYIYAFFCLLVMIIFALAQIPELDIALLILALSFWIFAMPWILFRGIKLQLERLRLFFSTIGLIVLSATWLTITILRDFGLVWLLTIFCLVWMADIGAYFIGRSFGRRPLAITISPGKTLEGALGGMVLCWIYAWACVQFLPPEETLFGVWVFRFGWFSAWCLVTVLVLFSILGDLFESLLKRLGGVKDSSALLPGHGGVLDRIDALLPVIPLAAFLSLIVRNV
ncbi:MAG: phosphatidate cytidylyltransferase [Polynucleobacter sp.]|nr:phosphatidate cytidylyltransferase [Polynucleobacter sp.]